MKPPMPASATAARQHHVVGHTYAAWDGGASISAPGRSNPRICLSVDFDYFCREEDDWDWGHAEGNSMFRDGIWITRVQHIADTSLDQHAKPHPDAFWEKLMELGFRFDDCESFAVADSHMWGAANFADLGIERAHVVNFDAHHDMGYVPWAQTKRDWLDKDLANCGNWLLSVLHRHPHARASVVYPEWKGDREMHRGLRAPTRIAKRFQHGVYGDDYVRSLAGDVSAVFIAKSSAWTPPWHDQAFADFVTDGAASLGLQVETPFEEQERCNPLDVRPFNLEAARELERMIHQVRVCAPSVGG